MRDAFASIVFSNSSDLFQQLLMTCKTSTVTSRHKLSPVDTACIVQYNSCEWYTMVERTKYMTMNKPSPGKQPCHRYVSCIRLTCFTSPISLSFLRTSSLHSEKCNTQVSWVCKNPADPSINGSALDPYLVSIMCLTLYHVRTIEVIFGSLSRKLDSTLPCIAHPGSCVSVYIEQQKRICTVEHVFKYYVWMQHMHALLKKNTHITLKPFINPLYVCRFSLPRLSQSSTFL